MSLPRLVLLGILLAVWQGACVRGYASDDTAATKVALVQEDKEFAELLRQSAALENSDTNQSHDKALQALSSARRRHQPTDEVAALYQLGHTLETQGLHAEAITIGQEGLALATTLKAERWRGEFYRLISRIQVHTNDFSAAADSAIESLHIAQSIDDHVMQERAEEVLGLIYHNEGEEETACEHMEAALRLGERDQSADLALELMNLGAFEVKLKHYARSNELYKKSLALVRQTDPRHELPFVLANLGDIASITGDQATAARYLVEATTSAKQLLEGAQYDSIHAYTLYAQAAMHRRQDQPTEARTLIQQSLAIAQNDQGSDLLHEIYAEIIEQAKARGDYQEAFEYANKLTELNETVRSEKAQRKVSEVQRRYEAQTHTSQVALLQRDKDLQQADLALQKTELQRVATQRFALLAVMICVVAVVSALVSRQRARARITQQILAETRAAKAQVEEADAHKAQLLEVAAQNLQESEAKFRSAFEHSALGMSLSDPEGRWLRVNDALCKILGYSAAEMLGRSALDITHDDDRVENHRLLDQLLRGATESYRLEKRVFHQDGQIVWVLVDVAVVREPDGQKPVYLISQFQDVTHRRRAAEQLQTAKEEAERANAAKSLFLSRMSHELRTPLNAILGFGQVLGMSSLSEQDAQCVNYMLKAGRHLLSLVDEVLDLTRVETGELRLKPVAVHVDQLVRECVGLTSKMAQASQIVCTVEKNPLGNQLVWADEQRLRQVLLNLLSNAIKYNRPGGQVLVGCGRVSDERLRLWVRDTGPGISSEGLGCLFVPFERLDHEYGKVEGSGLGLVVSKRLAEAMDGSLGVESEINEGSTFWVELPAMEDDVSQAAVVESKLPAKGRSKAASSATLLYVEDNPSNLQVVKTVVERLRPHWSFLCATDGQTGLDQARATLPDLILLDLQLPGLKGDAVLTELRKSPRTRLTPVLMLSADATAHSCERLMNLGANDYLPKPFDVNELIKKLDGMLPIIPRGKKQRSGSSRATSKVSKEF